MSRVLGLSALIFVAAIALAGAMPAILSVISSLIAISAIVLGTIVAITVFAGFVLLADNIVEGRAESSRKDRLVAIAEVEAAWQVADDNGLYAAYRPQLAGASVGQLLELSAMHQLSQRTWPNTPKSISNENYGMLEDEQDEQYTVLPSAPSWVNSFPLDGAFIGCDGETPFMAGWRDIQSAMLNGIGGGGKSNLLRLLLTQIVMQKAEFILCDPHGSHDEGTVRSIAPLLGYSKHKPAIEESEIVSACQYIREVVDHRIRQNISGPVFLFVVDEATMLLDESHPVRSELEAALKKISTESRKTGVVAIAAGQNFSADSIRGSIRSMFKSIMSVPNQRSSLGNLINPAEKDIIESLRVGDLFWKRIGYDSTLLRVPECSSRDVELILGSDYTVDDGSEHGYSDGYSVVTGSGYNGSEHGYDNHSNNHQITIEKPFENHLGTHSKSGVLDSALSQTAMLLIQQDFGNYQIYSRMFPERKKSKGAHYQAFVSELNGLRQEINGEIEA